MTKQEILNGVFKSADCQELGKFLDRVEQNIDAGNCDYDYFEEFEIFEFIKVNRDTLKNRVLH